MSVPEFVHWQNGLPAAAVSLTDNPDGFRYWHGGLPRAFEAVPSLLSVTPSTGKQGTVLAVSVVGSNTNFRQGVTVGSLGDPEITVLSTTVLDATHATLELAIGSAAQTIAHDVTLSTASVVTLRAAFTVTASVFAGSSVQIGLGGLDPTQLIFAGEIQAIDQIYEDLITNQAWQTSLIDYTFLLNRRRPFGRWDTVSATTIARDCVATFAPGFTSRGVQEDLPAVSITFDGSVDFGSCMAALATACGGQYVGPDYDRDIRLFVTDTSEGPNPIDAAHPPLDVPPIHFAAAIDQVRTRVYGKGHGETVPADLPAGAVILPIADAVMFNPDGGQAIAGVTAGGAASQILTYEGVQLGGGSVVGPGLTPASAPQASAGSGSGVDDGLHGYAYTDVTALGETKPSSIASITVEPLPAPASGPTFGTPTIGVGPELGSHNYAITEVTSAGETTPSPLATKVVDVSGVPPTMDTPVAIAGGSVDPGVHQYAVSFVTVPGESVPSAPVAVTTVSNPNVPPHTPENDTGAHAGGSLSAGTYLWAVTFTINHRETVPSGLLSLSPGAGMSQSLKVLLDSTYGPADCQFLSLYRTVANGSQLKLVYRHTMPWTQGGFYVPFYDGLADSALGADAPTASTFCTVPLSSIPIGGPGSGVIARNLWRTAAGGTQLQFLHQLADNVTTTWTDTEADSTLGAIAPSVNTAYFQQLPVYVPAGSALATSRNLWRTEAGGAQLKFLATVAGNGAAIFVDTVPDASLGADAPTINTAAVNQVSLSGVLAGQPTVTARNLWRTEAGGAQLKFLHQLADNVTTAWLDTAADATLGADAPTGDTSGLAQPGGQVDAGSDTLIVANPGVFSANGGWAIVNNQALRYTGVAAGALTGLPPSGVGSLQTAVLYSAAVIAQPALVGINHWNGTPRAIAKGASVHIWVQRDDLAAQDALGQLERWPDGTPTDGIREYVLIDERRGEPSLIGACDAELAKLSRPIVSTVYATRDPKTQSGETVWIDLAFSPWGVSKAFVIQQVTISEIDIVPDLFPHYLVTASSVAFSLSDLLRRMVLA